MESTSAQRCSSKQNVKVSTPSLLNSIFKTLKISHKNLRTNMILYAVLVLSTTTTWTTASLKKWSLVPSKMVSWSSPLEAASLVTIGTLMSAILWKRNNALSFLKPINSSSTTRSLPQLADSQRCQWSYTSTRTPKRIETLGPNELQRTSLYSDRKRSLIISNTENSYIWPN